MIIEVDEYKKQIPGYDPEKSEAFHSQSAKLADKDFQKYLKTGKFREVIFMAGGTASGKTEFAFSYLDKKHQLVYDGTLKNFSGFKIKVSNIKRYAKNNPKIRVVLVIPEDPSKSFGAFLQRDRKMKNQTFFDTQIRSRVSIAKILKETDFAVDVYVSRVFSDSDKLDFIKLSMRGIGRFGMAKSLILSSKKILNMAKINGLDFDIDFDNI